MTTNSPSDNSIKINDSPVAFTQKSFQQMNVSEESKTQDIFLVKGLSFKIEKIPLNSSFKLENKQMVINSDGRKINEIFEKEKNRALDYEPTLSNSTADKFGSFQQNKKTKQNSQILGSNFTNFKSEKYLIVKDSNDMVLIDGILNSNEQTNTNNLITNKNNENFDHEKNNSQKNPQIKSNKDKEHSFAKEANGQILNKENLIKDLSNIYNINFSNNIIDLSNLKNYLGLVQEVDAIFAFFRENANSFKCEELKICGISLSTLAINNLSYFLIQNNSIKYLDLSETQLGDFGISKLAPAFERNKNLIEINLQKNSIGNIGAKVLAEALQANENISKVELEHNFIGNKGAELLYTALTRNIKLKWLNLFGNVSISNNFIGKISLQLKNNRISSRAKKPIMKYPES